MSPNSTKQHDTTHDQQPRKAFTNKTLQYTLIASFILATAVLVISHHAITFTTNNNAGKDKQLLSVPLPPRQEAAKGGLPPIPDFVKRKLDDGTNKQDDKQSNSGKGEKDAANAPSFPLPSEAVSASSQIILQPTFGIHRPNQNAVFAFAEGYDLGVYITFIESLKQTNYTGDVVLAVSHVEGMKDGVAEYLKWYSKQEQADDNSIRVISYAMEWECYKKSGVRI